MINSQTIESYKTSDFEKLMNSKIKITLKKTLKIKSTEEVGNVFIGQIVSLGLSANSPHLPVSIDFLIENTDDKISPNIFQIDSIEI
ncbi:hypothetical protein SY27_17415 [Flavobacterium sp. 316]|uniref:hypothetical protein n=1 Tax=Flavobacterium sp. 316 TaxID=1603293 RepID=UPI0005E24AB6|nr:hypothetical protein [Flavobacterium sp. 316]KIX19826.1 hypothetical protein SY27_17415 [Flavobacterium sp. 316]